MTFAVSFIFSNSKIKARSVRDKAKHSVCSAYAHIYRIITTQLPTQIIKFCLPNPYHTRLTFRTKMLIIRRMDYCIDFPG